MKRALVVAIALVALAASAHAWRLMSMNTLHLGWSEAKRAYKVTQLSGAVTALTPDVVILQEVMQKRGSVSTPTTNSALLVPGTYRTVCSAEMKGATSYKETYCFCVRNSIQIVQVAGQDVTDYNGTYAGRFARRPSGVLLEFSALNGDAGWTSETWVVDFHAIWGNGTTDPQGEALLMQNGGFGTQGVFAFYETRGTDRVIVGGDWNLPANDTIDTLFATHVSIQPQVLTSITPAPGATFSSSYDHFVWKNPGPITAGNANIYTRTAGAQLDTFRGDKINGFGSDHIPVYIDVTR